MILTAVFQSPACILSFVLTASIRGELADAWKWSDVPLESPDKLKEILEKEETTHKDSALPSASTNLLEVPAPQIDASASETDGEEGAEGEKAKAKKRKNKKKRN